MSSGIFRAPSLIVLLQTLFQIIGPAGVERTVPAPENISVIHKIYDELKSRKLPYAGYKVLYDDFNYIPNNKNINSLSYALECCFHKNNKYSYQNEFRIVAILSPHRLQNYCSDVDEFEIINESEHTVIISSFGKTAEIKPYSTDNIK